MHIYIYTRIYARRHLGSFETKIFRRVGCVQRFYKPIISLAAIMLHVYHKCTTHMKKIRALSICRFLIIMYKEGYRTRANVTYIVAQ